MGTHERSGCPYMLIESEKGTIFMDTVMAAATVDLRKREKMEMRGM